MRSEPSPTRSRTRGQRTATGPMPVMISRSGRCPWRTSRWRPSSVISSAWPLSKAATSASTACASSARAPLRKTSVSGSAKFPGWESWKTLVSVTAYHSFAGEVEALNTPTIRRLTPSCRHQLPPIAPAPAALAVSVRINPRRHSGRAGLGLVGNDEAFPLCDLLGVQQLGRTDRFGFKLPRRFAVGFLGSVFAEELAADRDRRFVAGRRLDALLADEAVGKALHRRRWRIRCGAVTDSSTKQGGPSAGGAVLELANDALGDIAHGV